MILCLCVGYTFRLCKVSYLGEFKDIFRIHEYLLYLNQRAATQLASQWDPSPKRIINIKWSSQELIILNVCKILWIMR